MQEINTWFVCKYPSTTSDEGIVLWDMKYSTEEACRAVCDVLNAQSDDGSEYEPSDLPELSEVFARDVQGAGYSVAKH